MATDTLIHQTDPPANQVLEVPAGGTLSVGFKVSNDLNRPTTFQAIAEEQPEEWLPPSRPVRLAPYDAGEATFVVRPPLDASEGEYEISVRLLEGTSEKWSQPRRYLISVTPPVPGAFGGGALPPDEIDEPAVVGPSGSGVAPPPDDDPITTGGNAPPDDGGFTPIGPESGPSGGATTPVVPTSAPNRTVADPKDGTVIVARPGESIVVKFTFANKAERRGGTKTYIIRQKGDVPRDWVQIERDEVSITPNGKSFVSLRLKPPLDANPTQYPFAVETGAFGEVLDSRNLILEVQPTPAVTVACAKRDVVVWFRPEAEFDLTVAVAGNSDTAYRLVPLAEPHAPAPTPGRYRKVGPTVGPWRRIVDREMGNLVSRVTGRQPEPAKHKVRLRRETTWWWGIQDKHEATFEVVPVTDPLNGGKEPNRVVLKATRRRLLPAPWFLVAPLALLLVGFLSGGPSNLSVKNAVTEADGTSYVLSKDKAQDGDQRIDVVLAWKDALVPAGGTRVDAGNRKSFAGRTDHVVLGGGQYQKPLQYTVGGLFGGERANVVVVGQRTDGAIIVEQDGSSLSTRYSADTLPSGGRAAEYEVEVPKGKTVTLTFQNTTAIANGRQVWFFQTKKPAGFTVSGLIQDNGNSAMMGANDTRPIKVAAAEGATEGAWELVTTDAAMPIVRFKLKAVAK